MSGQKVHNLSTHHKWIISLNVQLIMTMISKLPMFSDNTLTSFPCSSLFHYILPELNRPVCQNWDFIVLKQKPDPLL